MEVGEGGVEVVVVSGAGLGVLIFVMVVVGMDSKEDTGTLDSLDCRVEAGDGFVFAWEGIVFKDEKGGDMERSKLLVIKEELDLTWELGVAVTFQILALQSPLPVAKYPEGELNAKEMTSIDSQGGREKGERRN